MIKITNLADQPGKIAGRSNGDISYQLRNAVDLCGRHGGYGMGLDIRQISWYTLFIKSFTASAVTEEGTEKPRNPKAEYSVAEMPRSASCNKSRECTENTPFELDSGKHQEKV